jgi:hypothetical protein
MGAPVAALISALPTWSDRRRLDAMSSPSAILRLTCAAS